MCVCVVVVAALRGGVRHGRDEHHGVRDVGDAVERVLGGLVAHDGGDVERAVGVGLGEGELERDGDAEEEEDGDGAGEGGEERAAGDGEGGGVEQVVRGLRLEVRVGRGGGGSLVLM
jgi:hypothetical protein